MRLVRSQERGIASKETPMRAIVLWILGVPISVIILLYVFHIL
jgi:hypothetical protein